MTRAAVALLLVLALAPPAFAQLYQWTDADGVTRYTNDHESIPPEYREHAREIGSPQARPVELISAATERGLRMIASGKHASRS